MPDDLESNKSPIKCIFIGLDNSGKTSILTVLENRFAQLGKLGTIQPTQRIVRSQFSILGIPIVVWDMGGQEIYKKEYLSKKVFFERTNVLFYIIDIQDPDRFEESLEYFFNILQILIMLRLKPVILVLFHKSDPDIKNDAVILDRVKTLKNLFLDLPESLDITFYQTSVFDHDTLSQVFVQGILKILPRGKILQEVLTEFLQKTGSNAIMLLDENVLTIAEVYNDETSKIACEICGPHFATVMEKLHKYEFYTPDTIEMEMQGWLFFKAINFKNTRFYLVFFTKNRANFTKINALLPTLTENLFNIIKFVL
ncbi:MAG: ADP-ribosylation factor-like protein [Candidatus Helarchaeota archaeon]